MKPLPTIPTIPTFFWLALAIACFIGAGASWQGQRLDRLRPPAASAAEPPETGSGGQQQPRTADAVAPTGRTSALGEAVPPSAATPPAPYVRPAEAPAGRQVLRCVDKGRVTYRDLNAGCPAGASQTVTVFPTEGVGRPQ
jgi:hypothetical protein